MRFTRLLLPLAAIALVAAACGDGPDDNDAPTATATPDFGEFGPPPVLGDNVVAVSPEHGTQISQIETHAPDELGPEPGVCIEASFLATPGITSQWFHILFDGELVTTETTWIVSTTENPEDGTLCYAKPEGFPVGKHSVVALVQDPASSTARQQVLWQFEVTP